MGKKVTRVREWTEVDTRGVVTHVREEKTCGPICKTVKVAVGVGAAIALLNMLNKR